MNGANQGARAEGGRPGDPRPDLIAVLTRAAVLAVHAELRLCMESHAHAVACKRGGVRTAEGAAVTRVAVRPADYAEAAKLDGGWRVYLAPEIEALGDALATIVGAGFWPAAVEAAREAALEGLVECPHPDRAARDPHPSPLPEGEGALRRSGS